MLFFPSMQWMLSLSFPWEIFSPTKICMHSRFVSRDLSATLHKYCQEEFGVEILSEIVVCADTWVFFDWWICDSVIIFSVFIYTRLISKCHSHCSLVAGLNWLYCSYYVWVLWVSGSWVSCQFYCRFGKPYNVNILVFWSYCLVSKEVLARRSVRM